MKYNWSNNNLPCGIVITSLSRLLNVVNLYLISNVSTCLLTAEVNSDHGNFVLVTKLVVYVKCTAANGIEIKSMLAAVLRVENKM